MATIECICPARPGGEVRHPDGDTVTLRPTLGFTASVTIRHVMALVAGADRTDDADILAALTEKYLYLGIESWTLEDARGKPVPVTRAAIAELLLSRPQVAMVVGEEADELYTGPVILPLVARLSTSSPGTPTDASTSAPTGSSTRRPKPSKQSSTTTTPTAAIATTSGLLDGASSTSPS